MKQKAIYISSIIVALFAGIIGTVAIIYYIPKENTTTDLVYNDKKNVTIEESDTIQSAISKVYDAVYVIESYRGNTLVGTGTGFAYKKDDKHTCRIDAIAGSVNGKHISVRRNPV